MLGIACDDHGITGADFCGRSIAWKLKNNSLMW